MGAGPGIGRSCALKLGAAGADLVVAARRREPLEALASELRERTGRQVLAVPMDLSKVEECTGLVTSAIEALGRLDIVVNVATVGSTHSAILDADWDDHRHAFEVNVVGTLEVSRAAARHMAEAEGGSIIQIGTVGTHVIRPKLSAYTETKTAMWMASLTMARELGPSNVRVNMVTPGYTTGEGLDSLFRSIAESTGRDVEEVSRRAAATGALQRHVDPDDIAEAVLFLASPRARNITGVEIPVDAGQILGGG
jgi:NAD(P)-dependent dehydrogenase (short-subunit alcohol dehydrogenase family)